MININTQHLLSGNELSSRALLDLLELAQDLKANPQKYHTVASNKQLVLLFEKPSLRTRLSFAAAIQQLGGNFIESISTNRKTEDPKDTMQVLNGYCDAVMLRTHDDHVLKQMADVASIPLINGLTELYHPCQILADLLTLKENFLDLSNVTLCYIGDGNNILNTFLLLAPKLGITINYCCPENHGPDKTILETANKAFPGSIKLFIEKDAAVQGCNAIYTDVWTSMGDDNKNEADFEYFHVDEKLMSLAKPKAIFMHCMPMERGKEVSATLPDAQCSVIFQQSKNRLHIQKALLCALMQLTI